MIAAAVMTVDEPPALSSPPSTASFRDSRLARFAAKRARIDNCRRDIASVQPITCVIASTPQSNSAAPSVPLPSSCCAHYLAKKHRYCDRPPLPSQLFCSHHSEQDRTRCDHCGTLVHDDELAKHVRMCPAAVRAEVEQRWPFRVVDVNTSQPEHLSSFFSLQPAPPPMPPLSDDGAEPSPVLRVDLLVERIRQSLQSHIAAIRQSFLSHAGTASRLPNSHSAPDELSSRRATGTSLSSPTPAESSPSASPSPSPTSTDSSPRLSKFSKQRHQQQCNALVRTMVSEQLLQSPHCTVIEMGAGKAGLSHCMLNSDERQIASVEAVVLVDSDSFKEKWDGKMRRAVQGDCSVERYRLDIKDLHIASLPSLSSPSASSAAHAVLIGKHLCGSALDLCINAMLHSFRSPPTSAVAASTSPLVSGLCIASCCHHRCTFDLYCNPQWLHSHNIDRQQFALLTRLSSWACNDNGRGTEHGWRASGYDVKEETMDGDVRVEYGTLLGIGVDERVTIGRTIKQWLDVGRVELLRAVGYSAHLTLFAPLHVTRENGALIANFDPAKQHTTDS